MTRVRGPRRPSSLERSALIAASVTVLSLTAGGCVVVHGEREVLPATTAPEAAEALGQFTAAYNKADQAYDRSLDADFVAGALSDIDGARLTAGHSVSPSGNAAHTALTFSDVRYTIPEKAGWPRWFVADAKANKGGSARWLMVFLRGGLSEPWRVSYLTLVAPDAVPQFAKDKDGWAETVPLNQTELAVDPADLSQDYATYLRNGGKSFADGTYTSVLRAERTKGASRPGLATQYIDEALTRDDYAPLALRTADGGALVFFTTHHYVKQTAAAGASVPTPNKSVQALTKGEIKQSLTMEFVSNQVVLDPKRGAGTGQVSMIGKVQGLTAGRGE
ncbi:hypothetical protein [Streptomyces sp. NPDC059378]|uniref:hypothetical protein n=1 Tax=Streptomyces sp. NPDC059378 TaxID=3346815 RepID=UPI00369F6E8E